MRLDVMNVFFFSRLNDISYTQSSSSQSLSQYFRQLNQRQSFDEVVNDLGTIYQTANRVKTFEVLHKIHMRLGLVMLGKQYDKTVKLISIDSYESTLMTIANKRTRMQSDTLAKNNLFQRIYQKTHSLVQILTQNDNDEQIGLRALITQSVQREQRQFNKRLVIEEKGCRFMNKFDKFALTMISSEIVLKSGMKRINNDESNVFLKLISQFNKNVKVLKRYEFLLEKIMMSELSSKEFCELKLKTIEKNIQELNNDHRITLLKFNTI